MRQLWKKFHRRKPQRLPFYEHSLMKDVFAERKAGAIDFMHFSTEVLERIAVAEAGTRRGDEAQAELAKRRKV